MTEFQWRNIGDGKPVRVQACSMCGVAPSNVDDCGEFGNPECPYFGIGREESETGVRISFGSDPVGVMIKGEYQDNCCKIVIPLHLLEESLEIPAHIDMNLREIEELLHPKPLFLR